MFGKLEDFFTKINPNFCENYEYEDNNTENTKNTKLTDENEYLAMCNCGLCGTTEKILTVIAVIGGYDYKKRGLHKFTK